MATASTGGSTSISTGMGLEGQRYTQVIPKKEVDAFRSRFAEAPWLSYLQSHDIIVVGAGGIGSWVSLCLARIGCMITLFDADIFETHNMGGQLMAVRDLGLNKARAVQALCETLVGGSTNILAEPSMYTTDCYTSPIVIAAVDSMEARKVIFEKWHRIYKDDSEAILIDGRLLAEDYQVYGVTGDRAEAYRRTLFSDDEIPKENCALKSTTHCGLGIASDIIGVLTNHAANMVSRREGYEVRDVPFKIVKSIPNFLYNVTFTPDEPREERADNPGDVPVYTEQFEKLQGR